MLSRLDMIIRPDLVLVMAMVSSKKREISVINSCFWVLEKLVVYEGVVFCWILRDFDFFF